MRAIWIAVLATGAPGRAVEPDLAEIERLSKSGETLGVEIAAGFPLRPQRVRDDKGIKVLVDLSHQALFATMWELPRLLRERGFRVSGSQATLDTVLVPGRPSRVRIPAGDRYPFAWWPTARYHVVLTHQSDPHAQAYLPEEKEALERFVAEGGGLVILGASVADPRGSEAWPLNGLARRFGASFATDLVPFLGARACALSLGSEWEATHRSEGKPVAARRGSGKGRVAVIASIQPLGEVAKEILPEAIAWCAGDAPAPADARLPAEAAGGGPIYPERSLRVGHAIVYYARNQRPELLEAIEKGMPRVREKLESWLPSAPPPEPMHLILSSGGGGGWAVNAYEPKEVGIISLQPEGVLSIFAHELAHTMAGPPNARGGIAGEWPHGNQGESHAGWFQGKAAALPTGRRTSHEPNDLFRFDTDGTGLDLAQSDAENAARWGRGSQRTKIWWVWQKLDDRYGPTWYPRWRWVQHTRWQDDPGRRLTWDETVEDMSIAVGEDLFPFFVKIGTTLSKARLESIEFEGRRLRLPIAPIEIGPAGAVRLEAAGDYRSPLRIRAASAAGASWTDAMLAGAPPRDPRWLDLYAEACERRRAERLGLLLRAWPRIVFTKHANLGGSHYAYTEGQSDAQNERHFEPGASLCLLEFPGGGTRGAVRTLLADPDGVIRDPDVSFDARRILFSWKRSDRGDDYHLYEMDVESGAIRQLTSGLGFADYEGAYLPDGGIVFNSTRPVQTVDCWWTEVSNLYACDGDGRYLRRLTFDQVHTNFPTVTHDGRVIYTRWEYSDRGQIYPQPLFQMNPDGTGQTELYGNNSWFPTTILHARAIPGTPRIVAILAGHHTIQVGKLARIDPGRGNQEDEGVVEIAPVRPTRAVRVDAYGQEGELFQYPYPLDASTFLVAHDPIGWRRGSPRFAIHLVFADGRRELLAADPGISCNQPIPLAPRPRPHRRPSAVDYRKTTGVFYVQDLYAGPGLAGVPRGTIERIRVVALRHRAAGIRNNRNRGPAGEALISTPISLGNGAWDVKVVLGDARVQEDGSACFEVPARTPVYFQALDANGRAVQTMRSWSTLQPGETFSCIGCHEPKTAAPPLRGRVTMAAKAGPRPLEAVFGPPRGFSFPREIQPILDRHCVRCHDGEKARSLLGREIVEEASGRRWSEAYLALTEAERREGFLYGRPNRMVDFIGAQSEPTMRSPDHAGSTRSALLPLLESGHGEAKLSAEELAKIACWIDLLVPYCGDYAEANAWTEEEREKYERFLAKRRSMEEIERANIEAFIRDGDG